MNRMFQEYKKQFMECEVVFVDDIVKPFELHLAEIEVNDEIKIRKFNRAKNKRETQKAYEEYLNEMEEQI